MFIYICHVSYQTRSMWIIYHNSLPIRVQEIIITIKFSFSQRCIIVPSPHVEWGSDLWWLGLCKSDDILGNTFMCTGAWMIVFISDASRKHFCQDAHTQWIVIYTQLESQRLQRLQNSNSKTTSIIYNGLNETQTHQYDKSNFCLEYMKKNAYYYL